MELRMVSLKKTQLLKVLWDLKLPGTHNEMLNKLRERLRNYLLENNLLITELLEITGDQIIIKKICDHVPYLDNGWMCAKCKRPLIAKWSTND